MNIKKSTSLPVKAVSLFAPVKPIAREAELAGKSLSRTKNWIITPIKKSSERRIANSDPAILKEMLNGGKTALFARWGIADNPEEVARVKRGLMFEVWAYTIVACIPVLNLLTGFDVWFYWVAVCTMSPLCLYVASACFWRYECIDAGQFVTYKQWLFG